MSGVPQLSPLAPPVSTGSATTQFGEADLARLAAVAQQADAANPSPTPVSSLLAGLPRPRVASTPSPLTTGGDPFRQPALHLQRADTPSARSTVMGMPVLSRAEIQAAAMQAGAAPTAPAPEVPSAGIASLDAFDIDAPVAASAPIAAAAPVAASAAPVEPAPAPTPAPMAVEAVSAEPMVEPTPSVIVEPQTAPPPARVATPLPRAESRRPAPTQPVQASLPGPSPEETPRGATLWIAGLVLAGLGAAAWFFLR